MIVATALRAFVALTLLTAAAGRQEPDDAALKAAVEQFFAAQQAEDIPAYLALWSSTAKRPSADQLKYVFDAGDDTFSNVTVVATFPTVGRVRVRVTATRDRVMPARIPGRGPFTSHSTTQWSLVYVREGADYKLVREGSPVDGLAESLIDEATIEGRQALLAAEPDLVNDELLTAMSRRAGQSVQMQLYAAAESGFERMLEVARHVGSRRYEGEALQNLANARYFRQNLTGALQAYEDRLVIERERGDQEGIAASLIGVATIRYTFAEYGTALTTYREALAIQEQLGDSSALATTLISTGNILYLQGDYSGAISDYTRSRDISRKHLSTGGEADALKGLARVLIAQGDYRAALDALAGVLAEGKARDNRNDQGTALLSIGDVHFRLGNLEQARAALVESRSHFEAIKDLSHVGRSLQALALVDLVASRFKLSEDEYRKSSDTCTAAGDKECAAAAVAGLAFAETAQDKFEAGIASYKKAIEAFTSLKRSEQVARSELGLSRALSGSGAHEAALDAAGRARAQAEALKNDDVLWRAQVAEAEALRRLRDRPKAIAAAGEAVVSVDRLLAVAEVRPSVPVARDTSSAFALLALLQAEDGEAAAAFETAERMRVHDLRLLLAPGERDIFRGMTDREREDERALAGELVSAHAQLSRERGLPKPDAARVARLELAIADATARRRAQQQALFERLPALKIWRGLMAPATRADVDALLPDASTVLMEVVVTEQTLLVLVARRGEEGIRFSTHFEAASRRTIAERVGRLQQPETTRDAIAWRKAALELVPGLAATFGRAARAIVVPHEVLWRVPFEALPTENGYVADTTVITYAPSVTSLVRAPAVERPAAPGPLAVVAAPELAPAVLDEIRRTAPGWAIRSPASAEQERDAIVRDLDAESAQTLSGAGATEIAVAERAASADVIHLAAPFRVNGASPLFSSMLLAPAPATDGTLEAREIMNLDLHARVTIFSDGASMTMMDAADETGAVAWAWRAAGVRAIVLPRWATDDAASNAFLVAVHARLRAGDAPDVALQAARAVVRASRATSAPYYWAGWLLVGAR